MAKLNSVVEATVLKARGAIGLAVIVTNEDYSKTPASKLPNLPGATKDGEALSQALSELNFAVCWKKNVSRSDLLWLVNDTSRLKYEMIEQYRCIFFIYAGHGGEKDLLHMSDGREVNIQRDILERLLPLNAMQIGDIPKIFLIDACRGESQTETIILPRSISTPNFENAGQRGGKLLPGRTIAGLGGYLIAYSTIPKRKAYEIPGEGGIWLSTLAKQLREKQHLDSLDNLLTSVNEEILEKFQGAEKYFQQPVKHSTLNKIISLDPNGMFITTVLCQSVMDTFCSPSRSWQE